MPDVTRSFRTLDPQTDRAALARMLIEARDYYDLWLGHAPEEAEVEEALTSTPPGCDPAQSYRLGLFLDGVLSGVAELSFGYPTAEDAFLGLMILAPRASGAGHGAAFHDLALRLARQRGCPRIYLGVLDANRRGWAFWRREGYGETGVTRNDAETGHLLHRLVRPL
jgi:RimJ/RimL family protein N-acetyltransferase